MNILDWPDIVRSAGIEIEVDPKFSTRSHGNIADDFSIVWHHDASPVGPTGEWMAQEFDAGESGENGGATGNIWVDYNGKWVFVVSGGAWHTGSVLPGMPDNSNSVGIETDHTINEAWNDKQLASLRKGTAAILKTKGKTGDKLFFHKQICSPPGRKIDPDGLEIQQERTNVNGIIKDPNFKPQGGGTTPGSNTGTASATPDDVFKESVFNYLFLGTKFDNLSALYTGPLAPVNDEALMTTIQAIVTAGLRSFQSGPDGSFIAFYPDYFGINKGAKDQSYVMTLEDIELVDFKIDVNDDELATDVFVAGDTLSYAGDIPIEAGTWLTSRGIVNIRDKKAMALLLGDNNGIDPDQFYKRFGLRPLRATYPNISKNLLEYLQALTLFMRQWAKQYSTRVQFTFMPELYPGMRILIKSAGVTVFVEEVVHTGSYETGFSTTATISSPASIDGGGVAGLPVGKL